MENGDFDSEEILAPKPKRTEVSLLKIIALVLLVVFFAAGTYYVFYKSPIKNQSLELASKNEQVDNVYWGFYSPHNNKIYYRSHANGEVERVESADTATFKDLGAHWAKDKNHVYYRGKRDTNFDPETTRVYSSSSASVYVLDKKSVSAYSDGSFNFLEADPKTFEIVTLSYARDNKNIFYYGKKIGGADVGSFEILDSAYQKDKNNVYFSGSQIVEGADTQSFISLGANYAKDKNSAYYRGELIETADSKTFNRTFIGVDVNDATEFNYARDSQNVYFGERKLDIEIDPKTFSVLGREVIKDSKNVYVPRLSTKSYRRGYFHEQVLGVDAPTFESVGTCTVVERSVGEYYKDKDNIYVSNYGEQNPVKLLDSIDASTFEYFGIHGHHGNFPVAKAYAKDKETVFFGCGEILVGADAATFVDLSDSYAKDKNSVWYWGKEIGGADVLTFEYLGGGYAKDKDRAYFGANPLEKVDSVSFEVVEAAAESFATEHFIVHAKDKNHVYKSGEIVDGVAPSACTSEFPLGCHFIIEE